MRPQWRPNHWVTFSESLTQVLNLLDLLFLSPSVSRGLWSSGAIHATIGVILSIHWARPWVLMWCHQRTSQRCSESSLSWRQVIWDPCRYRGQISLSAESSSSSWASEDLWMLAFSVTSWKISVAVRPCPSSLCWTWIFDISETETHRLHPRSFIHVYDPANAEFCVLSGPGKSAGKLWIL